MTGLTKQQFKELMKEFPNGGIQYKGMKCNVCDTSCECRMLAEAFHNAGYCKQSENIVEIVRCKDCVYFKRSVSTLFPHTNAFICDYPYGLQKNVSENDFCCHGAKMDRKE